MKTYIITLSKKFPKGHKKEGELTFFKEKFEWGLQCQFCFPKDKNTYYCECDECITHCEPAKIHTIRANYDLWAKRLAEVERGEACLSIRQWIDKPYRSKQVEIARLTKKDGIGLQRLTFRRVEQQCITREPQFNGFKPCYPAPVLASNDGLTLVDWISWFLKYDHTKPMAIIHFTEFRY